MKTIRLRSLMAAAFLLTQSRELLAGDEAFTRQIEFEVGASGFAVGDKITITAVRGDREHIEVGGGYLVEGTYTLATADEAKLALFCTTRAAITVPLQAEQQIELKRWAGTFRLWETNTPDGWLHVSFYVDGSSHGGVYFGERGKEETVMRDENWFRDLKEGKTEGMRGGRGNDELMAFLGEPVAAPTDLDGRYQDDRLSKVFVKICGKENLKVTRLTVDDSEFPFLLYGTLEGAHKLPRSIFEGEDGYTYGGCVRGDNGRDSSYFAVNIIPATAYPAGKEKACDRRLMVRLQMLAEKAKDGAKR